MIVPRDVLMAVDFAPFHALSDSPWGMTAHVIYSAIDCELPATLSPTVVNSVIRGEIGFDGLLLSDDIGMDALSGPLSERVDMALAAGCDVILHCSGKIAEMREVMEVIPRLADAAQERLIRAIGVIGAPTEIDRRAVLGHLSALLPETGAK